MDANAEQPAPNARPAVWDLVIAEMHERDRAGLARYGTRLQPHNGRDALTDAYQEALDLAVYLRQKMAEQQQPLLDVVYLDMDGVLVDFVGGALLAHGKPASCLVPGEWAIARGMDLSAEEFWGKCKGHDFWAWLQMLPDAREILAAVRKLGLPLWLLSRPSHDPFCLSGKYDWLCRHLPDLARRCIFAPDKRAVARPGALLIDDSDANVEGWWAMGGQAIRLPRPWNGGHESCHYALEFLEQRVAETLPRCRR